MEFNHIFSDEGIDAIMSSDSNYDSVFDSVKSENVSESVDIFTEAKRYTNEDVEDLIEKNTNIDETIPDSDAYDDTVNPADIVNTYADEIHDASDDVSDADHMDIGEMIDSLMD